jgi:Spy/CpxP family protein refolding chaperone
MARHLTWAFAALLLLAPATPAAAACGQNGPDKDRSADQRPQPRPKFWMDPTLRTQLGITDQQSHDIDTIFEASVPAIRAARKKMEQLEAVLSKTVHDNVADLATVSQQIDKVEAARTEYNKSRTLMLYRMNLVLSAEQRQRVREMFDRDEAARKRDDDKGRGRVPRP